MSTALGIEMKTTALPLVEDRMAESRRRAGLLIRGHLWTGQSTVSTITCSKCGRVGVISSQRKGQQIIVHSGRVENERLTGIDYCEIAVNPRYQN